MYKPFLISHLEREISFSYPSYTHRFLHPLVPPGVSPFLGHVRKKFGHVSMNTDTLTDRAESTNTDTKTCPRPVHLHGHGHMSTDTNTETFHEHDYGHGHEDGHGSTNRDANTDKDTIPLTRTAFVTSE